MFSESSDYGRADHRTDQVMWGRFPRCNSDSDIGLPGASHHRDWPQPYNAEGLHRGSASSGRSQGALWRGSSSANQEEDRRRLTDHSQAPPPCPLRTAPTHPEVLDFQGKTPPIYPHWCSLCDVTVMSAKMWLQHISGATHAGGKLQLLQRFPRWDCRLEPDSRAALMETGSGHSQSEHSREQSAPQGTANHSSTLPSKTKKKVVSRSSVVCVKFPPQAVDEVFLRGLAERFGPVIQVMMFPSLAFMELGSAQQAQDLVQFHQKEPLTVQDEQMEFTVSHTFSFPQSSRVVSFSPAPPAGGELMTLVRGFGSPLYVLVQPTAVYVEMEKAAAAQKLLNHFSSNSLKINGEVVTVTFSREFRSLMRVAGALKCQEEEEVEGGRGGSSSREQESNSRTWSTSLAESPSPGSQAAPAAPPAEEAGPEEDWDSSPESDLEGMQVIAATLEDDDLEDDDLENLEEVEKEEEMPQQEVDLPANLKNCCTTQDHLEEDDATKELHEVTLLSQQPCRGPGAAADTSSQREKRPHGPEESKRSPEEEQQHEEKQKQQRTSPRTSCGSSEETAAGGGSAETSAAAEGRYTAQRNSEEDSDPSPDRSPDSTWTRSKGRAAAPEEETLKRRSSSYNHEEPEGKRRSCVTAKLELDHQQGATSTPEPLTDSQSQQAEPAGGATEHRKPAQPVGTEFVRPVVGYFCQLCQVIYADEDEAKGQHCSSPTHYRKYQEKTGRDPWR